MNYNEVHKDVSNRDFMNNLRFFILLILLAFSIISIPMSLSNTFFNQLGIPLEFAIVFIIGLFLSPIFLSLAIGYLIISEYPFLKKKLYTEMLEILREKSIKRDKKASSDAVGFITTSMVISFALFVIFGFTSIMNVISNLPVVQMMPIPSEIEKRITDESEITLFLHTLIVSYTGSIMMFVMRQYHDTTLIGAKRYPGSRIIMAIIYSAAVVASVVMIYNFISNYYQTPQMEPKIDGTLFNLMTISSLCFSAVAWACDRLIFAKK